MKFIRNCIATIYVFFYYPILFLLSILPFDILLWYFASGLYKYKGSIPISLVICSMAILAMLTPRYLAWLDPISRVLNMWGAKSFAMSIHKRGLLEWESWLRPKSYGLPICLGHVADSFKDKKDYEEAERLYKRAFDLYQTSPFRFFSSAGESLLNYAAMLKENGTTKQAHIVEETVSMPHRIYRILDFVAVFMAAVFIGNLMYVLLISSYDATLSTETTTKRIAALERIIDLQSRQLGPALEVKFCNAMVTVELRSAPYRSGNWTVSEYLFRRILKSGEKDPWLWTFMSKSELLERIQECHQYSQTSEAQEDLK